MHEREEKSLIIVHGCMGELSHLMYSYTFEGIKFFFFLVLEYADIIKDSLVFILFMGLLKVDFPL